MVVAFSVTANYNVDAGAPADLSARGGRILAHAYALCRSNQGAPGLGFPSDLRDAEWARLAPLIPPAHQQK